MIESELSFSVKVKSSKTEPLDIKVGWRESDTNKSIIIFGKERPKAVIASIIEEILFSHMQCCDYDAMNETLDQIENVQCIEVQNDA